MKGDDVILIAWWLSENIPGGGTPCHPDGLAISH